MAALASESSDTPDWQTAAGQNFEVASVKPARDCQSGRGGGGRDASSVLSPERLDLRCQTVEGLIQLAYVSAFQPITAVPFPHDSVPISGGPGWIRSDRYDIDAKAEGAPGLQTMRGPMLQALLGDRFQLKIHRENREAPVYFLTVAKGGPKGLHPAEEGKCTVRDRNDPLSQRPLPDAHLCGLFYPSAGKQGTDVFGVTMADLCRQFTVLSDRTVIDRTGIAGKFDIHLVAPPRPEDSTGPPQRGALVDLVVDLLNLKIEPGKAPGDILVIDRIERPSAN